jgi:hypothetical protein
MEIQQLDLLLRLILAHLLADFIFQTDGMVNSKREQGLKSSKFYVHLAIVGLTAYLLLADWLNWWAPLAIILLHGLIDWVKIKINKDNVWVYVGDQFLHLLSLVFIWLLLTTNSMAQLADAYKNYEWSNTYLIICIAYILISLPSGVWVGFLTKTWQDELETNGEDSLKNAGKWIGIIERILILTFILINEWAPIGFLLAAKSVFRFGDLKEGKDHKKTEYILIGTLLSFTFAIFLGLMAHFIIG